MKKFSLSSGWRNILRHRFILIFAILAVAGGGLFFSNQIQESVEASVPTSGALTATAGTSTTWVGGIVTPGMAANGEPSCIEGTSCDTYTLTVAPGSWSDKRIRVELNWGTPATDYDMVVRQESNGVPGHQGDGVGADTSNLDDTVGTSGNGTNTNEEVIITPSDAGGTYYVTAVYFAGGGSADNYTGSATVFSVNTNLPASSCTVPTFDNYAPPVGHPRRDGSGEPSIGINWNTGNIMAMSRLRGQRVTFDDSTSPADPVTGATWFSNTSPAIVTGLDPILFTDPVTGRTIGGELNGNFTTGFISDDDITTISTTFQAATSLSSIDHQTIGGGPPRIDPTDPIVTARQPVTAYPHLFYYAAQNIGYADVSTSFDGGLTYQQAVPAYTIGECGGLHGHIKVAPDGTVYLPNKNCGGKAAVVVSEDNGLNWSVRPIPGSSNGGEDPSVGIGAGGRIYVSYVAGDGHPHVAVSEDKGLTWRDDFDLGQGTTPGLTASVFPAVVAGDNDRAAVFFLATDSTQPGDPTGDDTGTIYKGTWYPFVATTCDGGKSWSVVRSDNDPLNPGVPNPVQQGVVCRNGTTCPAGTRNLLDFNDLNVDSRGRIVGVYADGCNFDHPCINITDDSGGKEQNQGIARLTVMRQRGGMRLFSAFDPGGPAAPNFSPPVFINETKKGYALKWAEPDDGGSPLTSYRIYRGEAGKERRIAEVKANTFEFTDDYKTGRLSNVYYRVTAVNKHGESPRNVKFFARGE